MPITLPYGPDASQVGDLHLPERPTPRVVALLHGGFWRMPYGREQWTAVVDDLVRRGLAVWNVGYRRLGQPGVGWPEIASDVLAALALLEDLNERDGRLDLDGLTLVGHSAGGQLALACTSARLQLDGPHRRAERGRPSTVVALAPVCDLEAAFDANLGGGAARALLGGSPSAHPREYAAASPHRLLPHGSRLLLLHGGQDDAVPPSQSREFALAARVAGDDVTRLELPDTGHMDFLDPRSVAHRAWCDRAIATGGQ